MSLLCSSEKLGGDGPSCSFPVDDGEEDPVRHELHSPRERERTAVDVTPCDPVGDVDDPRLGCDARNDAVHHTDELVVVAEVGEEGDRQTHGGEGTAGTKSHAEGVRYRGSRRRQGAQ